MRIRYYTGYKYLLSSKKAFVQLLRSFAQTEWAGQVEEGDVVRVDKSFILQDFRTGLSREEIQKLAPA